MITDLERNPFEAIQTGDHVLVDADEGVLTITKSDD